MTKYFSRLPVINYAGMFARNLLTRVQFSKQTKANKTIFYPYQMREADTRLDVVSDKYYKDPDYSWLIAMTNDVLDPYYETGLTSDSLQEFVVGKYGSIQEALEQIAFWRNDWLSDDSTIAPATFDNLTAGQKKYYTVVLDFNNAVIGYERKKEDWIVSTNKIIQLDITANTALGVDDRVKINGSTTATVTFCNTSVMSLKHIQGVVANTGTVATNTSTISYQSIIDTVFCIDPTEELYWTPVNQYEYEQEINTDRRNIKLLDNRLAQDTVKEMIRLLGS